MVWLMRTASRTLVIAACICLSPILSTPIAAIAQSNLAFLGNTPVSDLSKSEIDSLYGAIKRSLNEGATNKQSTWKSNENPRTSATITPVFTTRNPPCANVELAISARDGNQPFSLRYCRDSNGDWGLTN